MLARRLARLCGRGGLRPGLQRIRLPTHIESAPATKYQCATFSSSAEVDPPVEYSMDTMLATAGCDSFDNQMGVLSPGSDPATLFETDSRHGNRARRQLESIMVEIEAGSMSFAYNRLNDLLLDFLSCFPLAHIIIPDYLHQGVIHVLKDCHDRWGVTSERVDLTNHALVKERLEALKKERPGRTVLLWMESVTSGKVKVMDVPKLVKMVKSSLGEEKSFVMVDSTYATPYLIKALPLGADATIHSTTRYLGGQSDCQGSILVLSGSQPAHAIAPLFESLQRNNGEEKGLSPFDAWLVLRGMHTLSVRMRAHTINAQALAEYLQGHKAVKKVYYPGLVTYSKREMASELLSGQFGGTVSFLVKADETRHAEAAQLVLEKTRLFRSYGLCGGTESSIEHCAALPGAPAIMPKNLLRVCVGLEDIGDLLADLDQALNCVCAMKK